MFFLYIQYYMHFYEIWCFLNIGYIWNRKKWWSISYIYREKVPFWFCGMSIWVIYTGWDGDWDGETPDSGIRMVCYQVWWSEIGCCGLVVLQVTRSGGLAEGSNGWNHWDGVLSELRWCGCYNNNYYLVLVGCGCMVWWGVSAVSGSSERYEIPCILMKSHDMRSNGWIQWANDIG